MLELRDVAVAYGDVRVLWDVSLRVERGEIVPWSAPMGRQDDAAARRSRVRCRCSAARSSSRASASIAALRARGRTRVAHVPEGGRLWPDMNVETTCAWVLSPPRAADVQASLEHVFALFAREGTSAQVCGTLSGGEQQDGCDRSRGDEQPTILMLDEPSLGLAPIVVSECRGRAAIQHRGDNGAAGGAERRQALEIADARLRDRNRPRGRKRTAMSSSPSDQIKKAYLGSDRRRRLERKRTSWTARINHVAVIVGAIIGCWRAKAERETEAAPRRKRRARARSPRSPRRTISIRSRRRVRRGQPQRWQKGHLDRPSKGASK